MLSHIKPKHPAGIGPKREKETESEKFMKVLLFSTAVKLCYFGNIQV